MSIPTITPAHLHELLQGGKIVDLIDVRTPVEFREVHVRGARLVPLDRLDARVALTGRNGTSAEPLYVICRSGARGKQACERFIAAGFANVVNVEGGTQAWEQAGFAVVRGKKAVSLERQVRIAAGLLALVGATLALVVHPWFIALSGFIGAGLVFAGITDTCGLGLLLARMPWNQTECGQSACCSVGKTEASHGTEV